MSRFMRGLFQTARTISTIDLTAGYGHRGEAPPAPPVCCMCNIGTYVQINSPGAFSSMFRRVVVYNRAHVRVLIKRYPSGLSMCVDCVHISSYIYSLYFSVVVAMFSGFSTPYPCCNTPIERLCFNVLPWSVFLICLHPIGCYTEAINRLGSQPSEVGATL